MTPDEATEQTEPSFPAQRSWSPWRWGLPAALLILHAAVVEYSHAASLDGFARFGTRMLASLLLLLCCTVWWLCQGSIRFRDRLLVLLAIPTLVAGVSFLTHKTVDPIVIVLTTLPWLVGLGLLWLWYSQSLSSLRRTVGLLAVAGVVFGAMLLVRWNGLDGRQRGTFSWRWTPTPEETFLATRQEAATSAPPVNPDVTIQLQPGDWPGFRGRDRDGVVAEVSLDAWIDRGVTPLWRRRVGPAWSSFAIVDGRLFTQEQHGDVETVVCYDAANGQPLWTQETLDRFEEALAGPGPRATPTFSDGRLYTFGATGKLHCLNAATGRILWSHDLRSDTDAKLPQWGYSCSPLAVDDLIVVFAGGTEGRSLLAFDAVSGEQRWDSPGGDHSYASPHVITLDGVRQLVFHDNHSLRGIDPVDGRVLWEVPVTTRTFQPMLQPHPVGDSDLVAATDDGGIARLRVQRESGEWQVQEQWRTRQLKPEFSDFHLHKGHIYGLDDGILCCLSLETGARLWKKGRYGAGQLLLFPETDLLLVLTEQKNELVLVAADPAGWRELATQPGVSGKTWNHAAFSHGRLYVRNSEEMVCLQCASTVADLASEDPADTSTNSEPLP